MACSRSNPNGSFIATFAFVAETKTSPSTQGRIVDYIVKQPEQRLFCFSIPRSHFIKDACKRAFSWFVLRGSAQTVRSWYYQPLSRRRKTLLTKCYEAFPLAYRFPAFSITTAKPHKYAIFFMLKPKSYVTFQNVIGPFSVIRQAPEAEFLFAVSNLNRVQCQKQVDKKSR